MATYDTDDEQIEALKRWWRENGNSLLISLALAGAGVFGWRQWEQSQQGSAEVASELYQQVLTIGSADASVTVSDEEFATAMTFAEQLRGDFADSIYARYAALFMARLYVERGELESAAAELQWILDNPKLGLFKRASDPLLLTARLRLARVVLAQEDAQRALDLLGGVDAGEFAGQYAEVEGDAWAALGDTERAREAYQRAVAMGYNHVLLELKLRDLGAS